MGRLTTAALSLLGLQPAKAGFPAQLDEKNLFSPVLDGGFICYAHQL